MSATVEWTLTAGDVVVKVVAEIVGSNVVFTYQLVNGVADLNGFFIDYGNNGGAINSIGSKANNMNGSDSDGDKLDGFDYAKVLGSIGGNDADHTQGTVELSLAAVSAANGGLEGEALLQALAGAEIGFRATSVGENRDGSLKLANTGEYCPPDDVTDDFPANFPLSNATLIFNDWTWTGPGPDGTDINGDGYFAVKIDGWSAGQIDFDDYLDQVLAQINGLLPAGVSVDEDDLLGVVLKGGTNPIGFYAIGDDDPDSDPFPVAPGSTGPAFDFDYWVQTPPPQGNIDGQVLDATIQYDDFVFVF